MKRMFVVLIGILFLLSVTACTSFTVENDQYMSNPVDALNYCSYRNQRLTVVLNLLETHMANGMAVSSGQRSSEAELDLVSSSISTVTEAIAFIERLAPPTNYEKNREESLSLLSSALNTLLLYQQTLREDAARVNECVELMSQDFVSIKKLFNTI